MSFIDTLTDSVRDNSIALAKMIFDTEVTERQRKAKEIFDKVYAIASNLFFIGLVITFVCYFLVQLCGRHPGLIGTVDQLRQKLGAPVTLGAALGVVALILLALRGLLFVFKTINSTELIKFYTLLEIINLSLQYLHHPEEKPIPFIFEMLHKLWSP